MRDLLHKNLKGNIKVHQCMENISYLRRLEVFSDTEFRIIFLKSRDSWLQSQRSRLSTKNAYSYLSKLIDLTRDHLYEVITQYKIIFSDSESVVSYSLYFKYQFILFNLSLSSQVIIFKNLNLQFYLVGLFIKLIFFWLN